MWKLQEEERELDLGSEELDPPLPPTVTSRVISKFLFFLFILSFCYFSLFEGEEVLLPCKYCQG
jgi:hypothetical protein